MSLKSRLSEIWNKRKTGRVQLGPVRNISEETGLQIGGYNRAETKAKAQVGVYNGASKGMFYTGAEANVQLGLMSYADRLKKGAQVGGINTAYDMQGAQVGFANLSDRVAQGAQVGAVNMGGNIEGAQVALAGNTSGYVEGVQISPMYNLAQGLKGFQFSGINRTEENSKGMQVALVANDNREGFSGVQCAGLANLVGMDAIGGKATGVQIAPVANFANGLDDCVQVGAVNMVEDGRSGRYAQIGALNFDFSAPWYAKVIPLIRVSRKKA